MEFAIPSRTSTSRGLSTASMDPANKSRHVGLVGVIEQLSTHLKHRLLTSAVDALHSKVFTIYFTNTEGNNQGIFYALPNTVNYLKNKRGYKALFKAIYWGDDPSSHQPFKDFVPDPGIELACTQENKL